MIRSLRTTAAILAVLTAMTCTAVPAFADEQPPIDLSSLSAPLAGGWEVNQGSLSMSKNPAAKKAFKKATKKLTGVEYKAISLLATQVVAGTNYCILCSSKAVTPDAVTHIGLMYIYEDLQGNAEMTGFKTIIGDQLMGGFTANTGSYSLSKNKDVKKAFKKAVKDIDGVSYTTVAYLGSQVVAGTNYLVLCRGQVVYPGAPSMYALVTVYKDLKGKCSVIGIDQLALGDMNDDEDAPAEPETPSVGIANPWSEYKTVAEAASAAGVDFKAPDAFGKYKTAYIQAMTGLAEVNYANGEKIICVRKGKGTDDVSGDYNEYKKTKKEKIGDIEVTLRMNDGLVYSAVWSDGKDSYSYFAKSGISKKTALKHIKKIIELNK